MFLKRPHRLAIIRQLFQHEVSKTEHQRGYMHEIWNSVQSEVNSEIQSSGLLKALLSRISLLEIKEHETPEIRLGVNSPIFLDLVERDLRSLIEKRIRSLPNFSGATVVFEITNVADTAQMSFIDPEPTVGELPIMREPEIMAKPKWFLNSEYRLSEFVSGDHSDFAVRAIQMLTESPQPHLRQLFIHGPSGTGKTHLLHALGWQFKSLRPNLNIKVFTADEFINDYHLYIFKKQMPEFRGKFRLKTDVLLLDDIHSMARAKGAQEELFNIFNHFEQAGKFIAFTSDRSPHQLEGFEPRMLTRFQGGLSTDVEVPNFEKRIEILNFKEKKYNFRVGVTGIRYIAGAITTSVRSLEGALFKIGSYQKLKGTEVTQDELEKLLPSFTAEAAVPAPDAIILEIAKAARLKVSDLKSPSRKREIVVARSQAMQKLRDDLGLSYTEIGRIFGRDHSTVISAIKKTSSAPKDLASN